MVHFLRRLLSYVAWLASSLVHTKEEDGCALTWDVGLP
jgi:hypothetical protein